MCERMAGLLQKDAGAWVLEMLPVENRMQHCRGKEKRKRKRDRGDKGEMDGKKG